MHFGITKQKHRKNECFASCGASKQANGWNPVVNGASQGAITARGQARVLRRTGILSVRCRDIGRVAPAASFSSALGATPDAGSLLVGRNGDRQQLGAASR